MKPITFNVLGEPKPSGSKRGFPIKRRDGSIGVAMTHDNPKTQSWQRAVAEAAREAYSGSLLMGPVDVTITFIYPRPKSHFGTGRNSGKLKGSAPDHKITKPDVLKCGRAIEDALTGIIWRDDSQVTEIRCAKTWGEPTRAMISVEPL